MPPRRRQQEETTQQQDAQQVAIIAGALAVGASAQATAASLSPLIGVPVPVLLPLLVIALSKPIQYAGIATLPSESATSESAELEATYRAHYILAASRRVQRAVAAGESREDALRRERVYFNQHIEAVSNRKRAASAVDKARARYGDDLGWYAILDARTSPECREANGKNFNATRIPPIGYPGAVHPHCRCKPGRKHATSQTVYSVRPDRRRAA